MRLVFVDPPDLRSCLAQSDHHFAEMGKGQFDMGQTFWSLIQHTNNAMLDGERDGDL